MSMVGGPVRSPGDKVAEFASYEGAQKAVSKLIESDIPAKDIAIVGHDLRSIETVTGRLGYAAAARTGAINGILLGLLFSAFFVLGTPDAALQLFVGVMLLGIAFGMLMSLVSYAIVRRRRDYRSVTQVVAERYEVRVQSRSIHRAREVLGHTVAPVVPAAAPVEPVATAVPPHPVAPVIDDEPPRYGERLDPAATGETGPQAAPGEAAGDEGDGRPTP